MLEINALSDQVGNIIDIMIVLSITWLLVNGSRPLVELANTNN